MTPFITRAEAGRLARTLAEELHFTAGEELHKKIAATQGPGVVCVLDLALDEKWNELVWRALECSELASLLEDDG